MTEPDIGVAIVHGIGSQDAGYSTALVNRVSAALEAREIEPAAFAFQEILWSHLLAPAEKRLLVRAAEGGFQDWNPVRLFVVETLADAVAYRRGYPREWDAYHQIHWEVYSALAELRQKLCDIHAPLVVLAHSLGSVIISDHIWDEQKGQGFGRDAFTKCQTLAGLVTFGSNIPLFTLGLPEIRCITFPVPGDCISPEVRAASRWCNYYDRDDVLGYPLRTLSPSFQATVAEDVELNAGNVLTSWNPLSHNGYWTEEIFVERVAEQLAELHAANALESGAQSVQA